MQQSINDILTLTDPIAAAKGLVEQVSKSTNSIDLSAQFSNLISDLKGTNQFKLEVVKKVQEIAVEKSKSEIEQSKSEIEQTLLLDDEEHQQALLSGLEEVTEELKKISDDADAKTSNELIKQVLFSKGTSASSLGEKLSEDQALITSQQNVKLSSISSSISEQQSHARHFEPLIHKSSKGDVQLNHISDESNNESSAQAFEYDSSENLFQVSLNVNNSTPSVTKTNSIIIGDEGKKSNQHPSQINNTTKLSSSADRVISSQNIEHELAQTNEPMVDTIKEDVNVPENLGFDSRLKSSLSDFESEHVPRHDIETKSTKSEISGAFIKPDMDEVKQVVETVNEHLKIGDSALDRQSLVISKEIGIGQSFEKNSDTRNDFDFKNISSVQNKLIDNSKFSSSLSDLASVSSYQEVSSQESIDGQVDIKRVTELQAMQKVEKLSSVVSTAKVEAKLAELGLVIKQAALGRIKSLNITLKPVELGSVEVAIDDVGGEFHIKMSVEKVETLETLQKQESEMKQSLNQQNATFSFSQQSNSNKKFSLGNHLKSNEVDDLPVDESMTQSEFVEEGRLRITI